MQVANTLDQNAANLDQNATNLDQNAANLDQNAANLDQNAANLHQNAANRCQNGDPFFPYRLLANRPLNRWSPTGHKETKAIQDREKLGSAEPANR